MSGNDDRVRRGPGPSPGRRLKSLPREWEWSIQDYLHTLAAAGQREATIRLRGDQLRNMARSLGCPPEDVTAEMLVGWFGHQAWSTEHRRSTRSAVRGFFSWAYKARRVPVYLGDELPSVRQPPASPRPVPDDAWHSAMAAADPRTRLMLRLAAEAGLRRAEVAQVHTRDVFVTGGAAQLVVHGKGGKERIVPISDDLAERLRQGAAGHTPAMPPYGWLFPDGFGGHVSPAWVGTVVARVLPEGYTMHKLRHRFASRAFRGTRNLRAVQTLLGHSSIATTERYTAVDDDEVRAAMLSAL
jgi:integrase